MVTRTLNFSALTAADPYTIGSAPDNLVGYSQPAGSKNGKIANLGVNLWYATGDIQAVFQDDTLLTGTIISATVKLAAPTGDSYGVMIIDSNGDGWQISCLNTNIINMRAVDNSQILAPILRGYSQTIADNDLLKIERNTVTGELKTYYNGVNLDPSGVGYAGGTAVDARYGAALSRYGRLKALTVEWTPNQTVTSINGGSPITASQTSVSSVTTGFTGLPASITATYTGGSLAITGITGTTNAPTFTKPVRVDGQTFPKNGTSVTFTYTNGAETASGAQTIIKDAAETAVVVSSPINDDLTTLFGAIFGVTSRSAANDDQVYHIIPAPMLTNGVDTILPADAIAPNGEMQFYNAGTFTCWVYTEATKINYYYSVTITESGSVVINGGLTTRGLTVSGPTVRGLTVTGL